MINNQFCKYPFLFKYNKKLNNSVIRYFNLKRDENNVCKNCIYKKRNKCSGSYVFNKKEYNKKDLFLQIQRYNNHIKKTFKPKEIKIELTPRCNLSCNFCFNINSFKRNSKELPTEDVFKIIDKIKKERINGIRFTGGEPFLRRDILKILKYAKSKDIYVKVNTNFTLIKEKNISILEKYVDEFLISFHSLNPKTNNQKIRLIKLISKLKIKLSVDTVVTKENIKNIEKFYDILKNLNVFWFVERPVPSSNYLNPINNKDVGILVEKMIKIKKNYKTYVTALPFCSYDPEKVKLVSSGAKFCGPVNSLAISPSGKIKPCYSINKNLGSALKNNIKYAWENEFSLKIRQLKSLPNICKKCKYIYQCLGGCRFSAKLINSDYSALDPLARPNKYSKKLFD